MTSADMAFSATAIAKIWQVIARSGGTDITRINIVFETAFFCDQVVAMYLRGWRFGTDSDADYCKDEEDLSEHDSLERGD